MGETFDNDAIRTVTIVMTALVALVWVAVFCVMLKNLWQKKLLYPVDHERELALTE